MISSGGYTQKGFTLLESIVTLGILASTLIPLYMLFGTNIRTVLRSADINEQSLVTQQILGMIPPMNPKENPTGSKDFAHFKMSWTSDPLTPETALAGAAESKNPNPPKKEAPPAAEGQMIQLYKMTFTIQKPDNKEWFSFAVNQIGWSSPPQDQQGGKG